MTLTLPVKPFESSRVLLHIVSSRDRRRCSPSTDNHTDSQKEQEQTTILDHLVQDRRVSRHAEDGSRNMRRHEREKVGDHSRKRGSGLEVGS